MAEKQKSDLPGGNSRLAPAWKPGQSGNPSGRPKGFGHLVRAQTLDGAELVAFHLKVIRGELTETKVANGIPVETEPSIADRMKAAEWLADRGWGRVQNAEATPDQVRAELAAVFGKLRERLSPEVYKLMLEAVASEGEE